MKSSRKFSLSGIKDFMATNRVAQLLAVFAVIILVWVSYTAVSSVLSTIRSQGLIESIANTLGDEYQQVEFKFSVDSQSTNMSLEGDLYRQGEEGLGVDAQLELSQVDQMASALDIKLSSSETGQYLYLGDLTEIVSAITSVAPIAGDSVDNISSKLSKSWVQLSDRDDTCYRNMINILGKEDSELRKEFSSAYVKNPLIRVHMINTLNDGTKEYYISTLLSNIKGMARDIRDSKVVNDIEGCEEGVSLVDTLATLNDEDLAQFKQTEAATRGGNIIISTKDGRMTEVRSGEAAGAETSLSLLVKFKKDESGRDIEHPKKSEVMDIEEVSDDFQQLLSEAQEFAAQQQQQQQMMPQMPQMGM